MVSVVFSLRYGLSSYASFDFKGLMRTILEFCNVASWHVLTDHFTTLYYWFCLTRNGYLISYYLRR
jgi:hypothetical protein